jgi:hypothetical protein
MLWTSAGQVGRKRSNSVKEAASLLLLLLLFSMEKAEMASSWRISTRMVVGAFVMMEERESFQWAVKIRRRALNLFGYS